MTRTSGHRLLCASLVGTLLTLASSLAHAQWTAPTPEELSMTSQPEVPGAAAVYLFREETTEDKYHMFSVYVRLKVLTDRGKEHANVELNYASNSDGARANIADIQGRTIHPDGTIIPFTGKPYEKLIEKTHDVKFMAKVFTMPDVEAGSIIEYRYKMRYDDNYFIAPSWYIQSDLFTRKAHYLWKPTGKTLVSNDDRGQLTSGVFWMPILPTGTEVKKTELMHSGFGGDDGNWILEVNAHDIPPAPDEDHMPPIHSLTYRVLFYYSPYRTEDEFWKNESKHWAKLRDKFIGPGPGVKAAVAELTSPSDTQDQKLRKLYAAVMKLENTTFTRTHSTAEDKSQGFRDLHTTDDIWARKRGNNDELTALFVAMARASGMKAYLASITSRDHNMFLKDYLNLSQLDDDLAIVNVDGKEKFFDPGARFCPYGHLAWKHTMVGGIRQTDSGADMVNTPAESYVYSRVLRVANLKIDGQGAVTGTINMTYVGTPGVLWRQRSLSGDSTSLEHELRTSVEHLMPQGLEIKLASIDKLDDYEQPLVANFTVTGTLGSSTGKRLLLPADLFESNAQPTFPHEKREVPVYFEYPQANEDAIRINFPSTFSVESLPASDKTSLKGLALYKFDSVATPVNFTIRRDFMLGEIIFKTDEYPDLRSFYSKMETKDQESVVLTLPHVTSTKAGGAGN
jgi:hypothetical protein